MKRLVLFDIDETMIKSDGAGRRALGRALAEVFNTAPDWKGISLSGKTDPQICLEVLLQTGLQREDIKSRLDEVFSIYPPMLEEEVRNAADFAIHEGVLELLQELSAKESVYLGLLTGNIELGARIKLEPFRLNRYFPIGAFGSDSADRMDLPAIAGHKARNHFAVSFSNQEVVIIGDAINDVRCAQGFGARSIAVNTGKTTREELTSMNPDYLFACLKDTSTIIEAICN